MKNASTKLYAPVLQAGRNCWIADVSANSAGLVIDGRAYYRAFHDAARQAKHYLLLAGWRFSSEIRLLRGKDGDLTLLDFLRDLCRENPELKIYILAWDFSANYASEWEWDQREKFEEVGKGQIVFRFDACHATLGSHHQKFVIVDGKLAFLGGMDFSPGTWDDRDHAADNPDRVDVKDEPHPPYHDVQAVLTGPVAWELTCYFQTRWQLATDETLQLQQVSGRAPRITPTIALPGSPVALSLNRPATPKESNPVREIYHLFLDAIANADQYVYMENQYLTSKDVIHALLERLEASDRPPLNVIVVLPRVFHSWVEAAALGPPQLTTLDRLREIESRTEHRIGVYYSAAPDPTEEVPVFIHSKVLIVDDRLLSVGSCNFSNRSMGKDSELNVTWEARPQDHALARAIRDVRVALLAEHCGMLNNKRAQSTLKEPMGLVDRLDALCEKGVCRLRRLTADKLQNDRPYLRVLEKLGIWFDPGAVAQST